MSLEQDSKASVTKKRKRTEAFVPTFQQDLSSESESDSDTLLEEEEPIPAPSKVTPLTREELDSVNAARQASGVIYLSKVPPFMKPQKVKHLLSTYAETNRIFLAPEDPKQYAKRVRFGGNKRRMFTEGWIEFVDKRKAKLLASTLNAQKIGGSKKGFWHDDLWNLKYLPRFKWDDLTAQIEIERKSREARLEASIQQGKRETASFIESTRKAKMVKKMEASRAQKGIEETRVRRHFNQRDARDGAKSGEKVNALLSKLF